MQWFIPRFLQPESPYLIIADLLVGMIVMVVLHCLVTGFRSREKNYLYLAVFFIGSLINAVGNLYVRFIIPTLEPYIGSWIMILTFILFAENYLDSKAVTSYRNIVRVMRLGCVLFFILSILRNSLSPGVKDILMLVMDISSALIIVVLLLFLLVRTQKGDRRARSLLFFELIMVIGAFSAMDIFKAPIIRLGFIPLPLLQGNFMFLIGMTVNSFLVSHLLSRDVIDLKVRTALSEMENRKLQELDRVKTEFMMNVSHELRTPLTIIGGVVGQLKKGKWGDSIQANRTHLDTIERNNLRLFKQVSNLLELSRLEQHRENISYATIDVQKNLSVIVGEFQSLAEHREVTLDVDISEGLKMKADPGLFEAAVLNLLSNAIKFTPPGGTITVGACSYEDNVRISVRDTGIGIPPEERESIFSRFHQAHDYCESSWQGTGVGLAIVKEIMALHNGQVSLESKPERGSCFILDFPSLEEAGEIFSPKGRAHPAFPLISCYKAELEQKESSDSKEENKTLDPSMTVLLVEDNDDLRDYLRVELIPYFGVTEACNGKEALKQIEVGIPDLIISDIMMPGMDGHQLYDALRADEAASSIPFLFLTARCSPDEKVESLEKGVIDYVEKPFSPEELIARVRTLLAHNASGKERYQRRLKESLIEFIQTFPDAGTAGQGHPSFEGICRDHELTPREMDVTTLLRRGMSDKEIASSLGLSVKTVGNYNTTIFRKFKVAGRLELLALGRE